MSLSRLWQQQGEARWGLRAAGVHLRLVHGGLWHGGGPGGQGAAGGAGGI